MDWGAFELSNFQQHIWSTPVSWGDAALRIVMLQGCKAGNDGQHVWQLGVLKKALGRELHPWDPRYCKAYCWSCLLPEYGNNRLIMTHLYFINKPCPAILAMMIMMQQALIRSALQLSSLPWSTLPWFKKNTKNNMNNLLVTGHHPKISWNIMKTTRIASSKHPARIHRDTIGEFQNTRLQPDVHFKCSMLYSSLCRVLLVSRHRAHHMIRPCSPRRSAGCHQVPGQRR